MGSHELVAPLQRMGLPVEETTLESGDLMWEGRGHGGASVLVGVEHKTVPELVGALRSNRLCGHQLLKMRGAEAPTDPPLYPFAYLMIEGEVLFDSHGQMLRRSGRQLKAMPGKMSRGEWGERLRTLHHCGGLTPIFTRTKQDTLWEIEGLYRWWTRTDLDQHKSHIAVYNPPSLVPISEFRGFIQRINGISFVTSKAIEAHFKGSIREAINASTETWSAIDGIGKKRAAQIVKTLGG